MALFKSNMSPIGFSSSVWVFPLFVLSALGLVFLYTRNASAISAASESAYRAAEEASKNFLEEIEKPGNANKAIATLGSCSDGIFEGKNSFGDYDAEFLNASGSTLSCSDKISRIDRIQIDGFSQDASFSLISNVKAVADGDRYRCTGTLPKRAVAHSGDADGLSANLSWQYAGENTARKCEYSCKAGDVWKNGACMWAGDDGGGNNDDGGDYVTTGSENQTKKGALGARGAFKAYGGIDMGGRKIENVATPTVGSDLATKSYVDEAIRSTFSGN